MKAVLKSVILISSWCFCFDMYAQTDNAYYYDQINYSQVEEYFELYLSGQYDIVATKLTNNDYTLKKHTPDYSIGKKDYSGDFSFEKSVRYDSRVPDGIPNKWTFKTIKYSDIATEYLIEFEIFSQDANMTFKSLSQDLIQNKGLDLFKLSCFQDSCLRIGNVNKIYCTTEPDYSPELELNPFSFSTWVKSTSFTPYNKTETIKYPVGENEEYYVLDLYLGKESKYLANSRRLKGSLYVRRLHNKVSDFEEYRKMYDNESIEQKTQLKRSGNIYLVPIQVGDKTFDYVIDSGASDMVINSSIESYLRTIGVLRDSDYMDAQTYKLADGSLKKYQRAKLTSVKIGSNVIQNIVVSISTESNAPLLLGKSFLDKFVFWKINNQSGYLEYKIR